MDGLERFARWYYRTRAKWNRRRRLIFPSPAELQLIELMGGRVVRFTFLQDPRTHFPAAIVLSMGPCFRAEKVHREVRLGRYYADFCNDLNRIIEVDGAQYHMDVVAEMDREVYLRDKPYYAQILRIKAQDITRKPAIVQKRVLKFLTY